MIMNEDTMCLECRHCTFENIVDCTYECFMNGGQTVCYCAEKSENFGLYEGCWRFERLDEWEDGGGA